MYITNKAKEGTLHRKLRYTRYKYRICLAASVILGVISVAAALIIPSHYSVSASPIAKDVECDTTLHAGITKVTNTMIDEGLRYADRVERANLVSFGKNTEWCQDEFNSYVDAFNEWCFDKEQLTINFSHTCSAGEAVTNLSTVDNVINTAHGTGYIKALKPTYSLGMYYDFNDVDYYATIVSDATNESSKWTHITTDSDAEALGFCQGSVISTTSTTTVYEILKALRDSGNYTTQDGLLDAYYVSWCGDIDNQLLAPTFSTNTDDYVTRIDLQCFSDVVYCIVTYIYENNPTGVTEECYRYTLTRSNDVYNWNIPENVVSSSSNDTSTFTNILKEI